jgi:uncharacterized membrane protein
MDKRKSHIEHVDTILPSFIIWWDVSKHTYYALATSAVDANLVSHSTAIFVKGQNVLYGCHQWFVPGSHSNVRHLLTFR